MAAPTASLKARALQWLVQREHSRSELRRKLLRLSQQRLRAELEASGDEAPDRAGALASRVAEVEDLLDWLQAERHLSEQRFVESRVNARSSRYGNVRIRQELRQHDAQLDAASEALLKASEAERALAVWRRKFGREPAADAAARARQMRFLAGRGFSSDVIRQVLLAAREGHATDA